MKRFVTLFVPIFMLLTTAVSAQITISAREIPHTPGLIFQYYTQSGDSIPVNVGVPGGPQVWDYTTGDTTTITTDELLDPAVSPPQYERANIVVETDQLNLAGINEPGRMYCYMNRTRLILAALETTYNGQTVDFFLTPYMNQYMLPLQMGVTWSNTLDMDEVFTFPEGDIRIELNATMNSEVDAYGTVQVPTGDYECLRIKNHVVYDLTVSYWFLFMWIPIYEDAGDGINYDWQAADVRSVLTITGQTNDPYFSYAKNLRRLMNSTMTGVDAGIADSTPLATPESAALISNYPNPFNSETVISYQLNESCDVSLKILDIMGRQVDSFDQGVQSEGFYELNWKPGTLSTGIYIVRLNAEGQIKNHMMIYMK